MKKYFIRINPQTYPSLFTRAARAANFAAGLRRFAQPHKFSHVADCVGFGGYSVGLDFDLFQLVILAQRHCFHFIELFS
jgi:hypothetical protein